MLVALVALVTSLVELVCHMLGAVIIICVTHLEGRWKILWEELVLYQVLGAVLCVADCSDRHVWNLYVLQGSKLILLRPRRILQLLPHLLLLLRQLDLQGGLHLVLLRGESFEEEFLLALHSGNCHLIVLGLLG